MEPLRDDRLIADLQALRPTPRPRFAAKLDERAAAGFPRRSATGGLLVQLGAWLHSLSPRQILIPAGGAAALLIVVATAALVLGQGGGGSTEDQIAVSRPAPHPGAPNFDGSGQSAKHPHKLHPFSEQVKPSVTANAESSAGAAGVEGETLSSAVAPVNRDFNTSFNGALHHRAVERSAQITLAADPKDVDDDASRVFEAVHANNGIVMRSSTQEGRPGEAGATFDLLIPSAKLDDAMAAFSEIDAVRARHEATADITAPTVSAAGLLKESRARIDSLLAQLEAAETEEEQEAVEAELRHERRHASRLAAQLTICTSGPASPASRCGSKPAAWNRRAAAPGGSTTRSRTPATSSPSPPRSPWSPSRSSARSP
jgi:hypothetical protein